jgi:hypothetical protein
MQSRNGDALLRRCFITDHCSQFVFYCFHQPRRFLGPLVFHRTAGSLEEAHILLNRRGTTGWALTCWTDLLTRVLLGARDP